MMEGDAQVASAKQERKFNAAEDRIEKVLCGLAQAIARVENTLHPVLSVDNQAASIKALPEVEGTPKISALTNFEQLIGDTENKVVEATV
ncbi:MAG: hypothetical protein KAJ19_26685, partial [Gammaproteobacteria bacterium]|nr:hypothetical protein [Gammaproteobacteria bacterium]